MYTLRKIFTSKPGSSLNLSKLAYLIQLTFSCYFLKLNWNLLEFLIKDVSGVLVIILLDVCIVYVRNVVWSGQCVKPRI